MDSVGLKVIAVHPTVTIVADDRQQQELPTQWFSSNPKIGQEWRLQLEPIVTLSEQYALLNRYLSRG